MFCKKQWTPNEPEPRIAPLVEVLTATGELTILGSSEGHLARICDPYVYFSCAPEMAERLAARLDRIRARLNYDWQLSGRFNQDSKLCFDLRSPELFHAQGLVARVLNYSIFRKRIDRDLAVLAKLLCRPEAADLEDIYGNQDVRRQRNVLAVAGKATRPVMAVTTLILISSLPACGTPDVELQHETTGSDELLLSPCVGRDGSPCAPVPYRAPAFTWIGVG